MKFRVIVCPFDYSPHSRVANQLASLLAAAHHAQLVYVHVVAPELFGSIDSEKDAALRDLQQVQPEREGIACDHEIRYGHVVEEICHTAKERTADVIVVGSRGETGAAKLLHGSVAAGLLKRSPVPVIMAHWPHPAGHVSSTHHSDMA